jgi:hypothetical protein
VQPDNQDLESADRGRACLRAGAGKGDPMMTKPCFYTVVENAGYEGEQDIRTFASLIAADRWLTGWYAPDEIETLHVLVRRDCGDEREWM